MAGKGLARYQVMEPLGAGSQGHTYRGIDRERNEEVAIKVLSLGGTKDWKAFELFEREAAVLANLRHPGIPRFRDSFAEDSGDYFLVMDLVEGRTLAEQLGRPAAFDEPRLRKLMLEVLDILAYLHGRTPPVIHRDIKPANLIVDKQDRVHLVDFGGVRLAGGGGSTMVGTFGYMAPEQLHGEAGPSVDLYALGATIVALASGRPADELPHEGLAIDLDALALPPGLMPALRRLLEPDPRRRASSVSEVRALLDGPAASPSGRGRPAGGEGTASTALAVPRFVDELARVPKPLSILVWLASMFGAAVLLFIEFAILPIAYLLMRAVADKKAQKGEPTDDDEASITSLREFRQTTSRQRELALHVVQSTSPLRDDPLPLPPAPGDRGARGDRGDRDDHRRDRK